MFLIRNIDYTAIMKKHTFVQSCLLILILLSAQLSSAFGAQSLQMDCAMDMTEHSMMMSEAAGNSDTPDSTEMDCCNQPTGTSCCDNDCQCGKLLTSQTMIENSFIQQVYKSDFTKHLAYSFRYTSQYLHQLTPPPIV